MKRLDHPSTAVDMALLEAVKSDDRLNAYHISLYTALLYYGKGIRQIPFHASRRKLMGFSRIKSGATYHKCLRELISYGYLDYHPSFHPQQGSRIVLTATTVPSDDDR
ncbi:hypothetical protein J2Y45_001529 [Dyadobacter sp. BE34]|uniref:Uncharacterized protein n=1 Tax=Dyadobacter fermentans TaxID=94254 RepID=A0ABU1QU34_9BACT|nr:MULTISPECIES: hypothetical protein [Dyadobacter]MDR6804260.1 hypothetical protein [Dyadobacter fermentans]MDR7042000.1 hypothetical protein [Dyadobacter sp. BE242]MDR7196403.1 hypothetical protein [Dyadobacter sp. BE34]MDR7213052.1 hypothetical protein [Dyadobacter sp. BE31]MDR7261809.1 hypothetical protein [Dyadobacter sp. BE32]